MAGSLGCCSGKGRRRSKRGSVHIHTLYDREKLTELINNLN